MKHYKVIACRPAQLPSAISKQAYRQGDGPSKVKPPRSSKKATRNSEKSECLSRNQHICPTIQADFYKLVQASGKLPDLVLLMISILEELNVTFEFLPVIEKIRQKMGVLHPSSPGVSFKPRTVASYTNAAGNFLRFGTEQPNSMALKEALHRCLFGSAKEINFPHKLPDGRPVTHEIKRNIGFRENFFKINFIDVFYDLMADTESGFYEALKTFFSEKEYKYRLAHYWRELRLIVTGDLKKSEILANKLPPFTTLVTQYAECESDKEREQFLFCMSVALCERKLVKALSTKIREDMLTRITEKERFYSAPYDWLKLESLRSMLSSGGKVSPPFDFEHVPLADHAVGGRLTNKVFQANYNRLLLRVKQLARAH